MIKLRVYGLDIIRELEEMTKKIKLNAYYLSNEEIKNLK